MKKFLLIAILGTKTQIVKEGSIEIVQATKSKLKKEQQWKRYVFQIRTVDGYKNVKILMKDGEVK